jgi:hypothetical protein
MTPTPTITVGETGIRIIDRTVHTVTVAECPTADDTLRMWCIGAAANGLQFGSEHIIERAAEIFEYIRHARIPPKKTDTP